MNSTSSTTGLIVTATAALATLCLTVTACYLYVTQGVDEGNGAAVQAAGALATTVALAARTGRDAGTGGGAPPVEVTADDPLPVTDVEAVDDGPDPSLPMARGARRRTT